MGISCEADKALTAPQINEQPTSEYAPENRRWQGIPSIERTKQGTMWATFYSGGDGEPEPENYVILCRSNDDGATWADPFLVVEHPEQVRTFDPCLWLDPVGHLWLFWAQSYDKFDGRAGVWAAWCENPDAVRPIWTAPRRIANGIMMNKPTVLSTGEWLFPTAVWAHSEREDMAAERFSNVLQTTDAGSSFEIIGHADIPDRVFDEHMIVERKDGSLWMLVRTSYGIGQSISYDRGRTWSPGEPSSLDGPSSRFFIRRLASGRLLLVNHHNFTGRNNLTAMLSDDDGHSWQGGLLLDGRDGVSYPDSLQTRGGRIFVIYDHDRRGAGEILLAVFREEDILAGKCVSEDAGLQMLVSKL